MMGWDSKDCAVTYEELEKEGLEIVPKAKLEALQLENDFLRVRVQDLGCPYGYMNKDGICELGYPGCSCMDDLAATMSWCPEDEEKATVRLGKRLKEAEAAVVKLRAALEDAFQDLEVMVKIHEDSVDLSEYEKALADTSQYDIVMCEECGKYPADLPASICPGCDAYKDHLS